MTGSLSRAVQKLTHWWADAAPLLILQGLHWDSAEEQQQQLWRYSGYLSSQDGRGGYGGASSSTSLSLQGLAAGGPDISEWWQVTWKRKTCLCTAVYEGLPREFLEGFLCVGSRLLYVQNNTSNCFQPFMIVHTFQVLFYAVVYIAMPTFPQAASSTSSSVTVFLHFPECLDTAMEIETVEWEVLWCKRLVTCSDLEAVLHFGLFGLLSIGMSDSLMVHLTLFNCHFSAVVVIHRNKKNT